MYKYLYLYIYLISKISKVEFDNFFTKKDQQFFLSLVVDRPGPRPMEIKVSMGLDHGTDQLPPTRQTAEPGRSPDRIVILRYINLYM